MRRSNRSPSLAGVAIVGAVALTACCGPRPLGLASGQRPLVQPSMAWAATVPPAQVQPRLSALSTAVGRLRRTTGTGWIGRQDDATGYLASLSGGSFPRPQFSSNSQPSPATSNPVVAAGSLFASFARDLFGVDTSQLHVNRTDGPDPRDRTRSVTLRVQQQVGDIPVLDGRLAVTVSSAGSAAVTAVAGRVFPGLTAPRSPAVTEAAAAGIAALQGEGTPVGPGRLVIVPTASGIQAWEIVVFSSRAGAPTTELVYVDAASGRVVEVRPDSTEDVAPLSVRSVHGVSTQAAAAIGTAGVQGETVDITGADALGNELKAKGLRTSDGTIVLVDTTLPAVSAAGETGDIETHDASSGGRLPGPLVTSGSTRIRDPDAIAAQTLSRYIADYYRNVFGRNSWDGRGGAFVSSVHYGPPTFCNSQFSPSLRQMIYGNACMVNGVPQEVTEVEIDTAAHEITHGVTATTAGLNYTGQSGAMNEGFSDYFGNVIGDAFHGRDSNGVFEGSCHGIVRQTLLCNRNPDGTYSLRYLPNGAKLSDYLDLLDAPAVTGIRQDHGGVHSNSAVWNNVLWSIRLDLARIDGKSMLDSPRAHGFDRIVFAALTRYLTPIADFVAGRAALEQAARALGADAVTLRVITDEFERNQICAGCAAPSQTVGQLLSASGGATEQAPALSGDDAAWIDLGAGGVFGKVTRGRVGAPAAGVPDSTNVASVAFAGPNVVSAELAGGDVAIVMQDQTGRHVVGRGAGIVPVVGGSAEGAVWIDLDKGTMNLIAPSGAVTSVDLPAEVAGESFDVVAAGGGTVAAGGDRGSVVVWRGGAKPEVLTRLAHGVDAVAAFGTRVAAIAGNALTVFDTSSGAGVVMSRRASPFGLAMSDRYVVWAEIVGKLGGSIAKQAGLALPDTDLHLFSSGTGGTYAVVAERGQQGFPALSGLRIAWQDAVNGGNDIYTGVLPAGL